ncbi:hypothetical protein H5410_064641 [Solanum commersonii]|uniref:Uncharacterized protein n=1 Tax=Solanum commersonii TaxID=4109 RepID=A0A9J5VYW2_SOLCO|nr:hypothetical protein H5410_064641 [Solanum commersonii]
MATKFIFLLLIASTLVVVSTNARSIKFVAKSSDEIYPYYPLPRSFGLSIATNFGNGNANDESVLIGSGKVEVNDGALGRY